VIFGRKEKRGIELIVGIYVGTELTEAEEQSVRVGIEVVSVKEIGQ